MKRTLLLCSLLSVSAVGWADPPSASTARGAHMRHAEMSTMCPEAVPGTTITTADTPRGIAVTFVTSQPSNVAELRRRVMAMVRMHESRVSGGRPRRMRMHVIPGSATVEDVRNGARVVFEPEDAANLDDLRTHVRVTVQMMGAGDAGACPMMQLMKAREDLQEEEEGRPR